MKFIKHAFDSLNTKVYFDININIMFTHADKKHRRMLENFLCCDNNYKKFMRNYLDLKSKVKADKELAKSIIEMYKDLLYSCDIKLDMMYYITPLIVYLFIDTMGKLHVGNLRLDNNFNRTLNVLFNERLSMRKTVSNMRKCLGVKDILNTKSMYIERLNGLEIDLYYLQTYMYLYSFI